MVHKHLSMPHRFVVVTDHPIERWAEFESDPDIYPIELWGDWRDLARNDESWGENRPSCYVRLKAFAPEAVELFGPRFVSMDLDCVVLGALDPLFDREEDFVMLRRTPMFEEEKESTYQGSMWMMNAGARPHVWENFIGDRSIKECSNYRGTDQAWIRHCLGANEAGWTEADGVYCWRNLQEDPRYFEEPPENARILFFNTAQKPWQIAPAIRVLATCYRCGYTLGRGAEVKCGRCGVRNQHRRKHEWIADIYEAALNG